MGLRGPRAKPVGQKAGKPSGHKARKHAWEQPGLSLAERVIRFIESLRITVGAHAGRRFILRLFQRKIIRTWYAETKRRLRVVRTALLTMARKNGKSTLIAALALAHLLGPLQEKRGQIVVAASDRDQASLIFDEVVAFIEDNAEFSARVNIQRHAKIIEDMPSGSKLIVLSSDAKKAHGMNPSVVILDELAQWAIGKGRRLYDALVTATGARKKPLTIVISTQASTDQALMSELVDYGKRVLAGSIDDPSFSPFIFEAPPSADPWKLKTWRMANPALGDFRSLEELRGFAKKARLIPTMEASFRNFYLNQRVSAEERWIPEALWDACRGEVDFAELAGQRCYGGLDLGSTRDLTAFALFWPESGSLAVWTWVPGDNLAKKSEEDLVPYAVWAKAGHIEPTPGLGTDKRRVARRLAELSATFAPEAIAYDRWGMPELKRILSEEGIELPMREFGQGYYSMAPAMRAFEELVLNVRLVHDGNPVLRWAISNVVPESDAAGNMKPSKEKSRDRRIDPAVAAIMAVGVATSDVGEKPAASVYEHRGLIEV